MYRVNVRDHMLIAHSLKSEIFGPASKLHGATYVIDAEFRTNSLDDNNVVIDIGLASRILKEVIAQFNYKNLDELREFQNQLTTTEFLAGYIHQQIKNRVSSFFKGTLKITLHESPNAWASYED